jgi:hypothetical protein
MPDTFTHIIIPGLFRRYFGATLIPPLVLIGTVIPDYLREFFIIILPVSWFSATLVFHSLPGIILSSLFFTSFFNEQIRKTVFISLLLGQTLHLLFDSILFYQCGGPLYLFLPYWKSFSFALIPESDWIYIFFFSMVLLVIYSLTLMYQRYRKSHGRY